MVSKTMVAIIITIAAVMVMWMDSPNVYGSHLTDEEPEGWRRTVTHPRSCRYSKTDWL